MKRSIIAAHAIMIVGIAAAQSFGAGETPRADPIRSAERAPAGCGEAVWPYVPTACGARPVRVVRVEALR